MTSQNSVNNNITLFQLMRDDIRHKTWMIALSILGSFLAGPVALLFVISNYRYNYYYNLTDLTQLENLPALKAESCLEYLAQPGFVFQMIIVFAGALLVGLFSFHYLYSRRMVDLWHSAPVSRKRLFLSSWLNGFLVWFLPCAVANLLVFVISIIYIGNLSFAGSLLLLIGRNLLFEALCYLIVFHCVLVPVMLSGNVINAIINTGIYGLFFFVAFFTWYGCMRSCMDTFYLPDKLLIQNPIYILSPLTSPVIMAIHITEGQPLSTWLFTLVGSSILMIVNFFLALWLYQKRPSELAARGLDHKIVQPAFRCGVSFLSGLVFALFFNFISGSAVLFWTLFGVWFGVSLCFCILNIVYHISFREIFSHRKQYLITLAASAACLLILIFDVFGYDTWVPSRNSIKNMALVCDRFNGQEYYYVNNIMNEYSSIVYDEPDAAPVFTDQDAIHDLLTLCTEDRNISFSTNIRVKVNAGLFSHYRQYRLGIDELALLAPFVESEDYLNYFYPAETFAFGLPESITLSPYGNYYGPSPTVLNDTFLKQLTESYQRDFSEHSTVDELLRDMESATMHMHYLDRNGRERIVSLDIPVWYENTISLLKEWYPDMAWDGAGLDIYKMTLTASVSVNSAQQDAHEILYNSFGYTADGTPMELPPYTNRYGAVTEEDYYKSSNGFTCEYSLTIDDPATIARLRPHMIFGYYNNPVRDDYVDCGRITLPDDTTMRCYVEYGKLPLDILERLGRAGSIVSFSYDSHMPVDEFYNSFYY